jgi:nucleoside-diphosphate-sugar epimerase
MERLKIAITGASGFVGANLVRYFSEKNEVFALARNINSWRLTDIQNKIKLDITNREKVANTFKKIKPEVTIHCAVYGGYHFEKDTRKIIDININGGLNVLDACKNNSIFINTGSSSEYGIRHNIMKEDDKVAPNTAYAMSKALITNVSKSHDFKAITLRLFSVYGYYEETHRLIPSIINAAINFETVKLSNPNNVRDFVFVEDVCRAYDLAIRKHNRLDAGDVLNVGSGRQSSVRDIVKMTGVKVSWSIGVREKEPKRIWKADISEITKKLNWKPENTLKEGLLKTRKWMENNIVFYEVGNSGKYSKFDIGSK